MRYLHIILTLLLALGMSSCAGLRNGQPQTDQLERKARSELLLRELGVPLNPELDYLPSVNNVTLRAEREVEQRVLCLLVLGIKAEGMPPQVVSTITRRYELQEAFTKYEQDFLAAETLTSQQIRSARWRYESARTLLWALQLVDELAPPDQITDVSGMVRILSSKSPESFSAEARLRSKEDILNAADLAYRLHAASHAANALGQRNPAGIRESVVFEREYALKWLIHYNDMGWGDQLDEAALEG